MADRYFVATGNWSSTSVWSATDGGAGGASVPTAADDVYITTAFNGTLTINQAGLVCRSLTVSSGSTTTLQHNGFTLNVGTSTVNPNGYILKFASSMTYNYSSASASCINLVSTSATQQKIDLAGKTTGRFAISNSSNYILDTNGMTVDPSTTFTLTAGTFSTNGLTMNTPTITASGSTTRTLNYANSTWNVTGNAQTVINMSGTNLTVVNTNSTVNLTYSGSTGTRTISTGNTSYSMNNFNVTAGTDIVSCSGIGANDINFTGFSGTLAGTGTIGIAGGLILSTGMTLTNSGSFTFTTSGSKTVDLKGKTLELNVTFNQSGTITLASDFTAGVTRTVNFLSGTLAFNGYKLKTGFFTNSNSNTRTLDMLNSTLELTGAGTVGAAGIVYNGSTSTGLTIVNTNSLIKITSTDGYEKVFTGGSKSFNNIEYTGTGRLTINSSNNFNNFKVPNSGVPVYFQAGTTTTVVSSNVNGTSGALTTFRSTTSGTRFIFNQTGSTINWDYMDVKDMNNTSVAVANIGAHSVDSGNNLRIALGVPPFNSFFSDF